MTDPTTLNPAVATPPPPGTPTSTGSPAASADVANPAAPALDSAAAPVSTSQPTDSAPRDGDVSSNAGEPAAPADPDTQPDVVPPTGTPAVKVNIKALTLLGDDLAGLHTVLLSNGKVLYEVTTGSDGMLSDLSFTPGCELCVKVKRFDGTLKTIHTMTVPSSDTQITLVSPSFVTSLTTEAVDGAPASTDKLAPTYEAADKGVLQDADAIAAPPENSPSGRDAAQPTSSDIPASAATPAPVPAPTPATARTQAPAPAPAPARPTTEAKPKPKPLDKKWPVAMTAAKPPDSAANRPQRAVVGRDSEGNPIAVFVHKVQDWWGSWHAPTMHLWGGGSVGAGAGAGAEKSTTGAASAPEASPPAARAVRPGSEVQHHQDMVAKLATLFAFYERQIHFLYLDSAAGELSKLARGTFNHADSEKSASDSKGYCYKYVKVALKYCQIVDAVLEGEAGSSGGAALLANGFTDVTSRVPDHRWAAAGDVIVYAWSEGTWEKRRRSHRDPHIPNYGHIEIRHTEHYYSDFRPASDREGRATVLPTLDANHKPVLDANKKPVVTTWAEYVHIRIYRKVYDLLPTLRIKAFLRCLRDYECQSEPDDAKRYQMQNSSLPGTRSLRFESFDKHPWADVPKSSFPPASSGHSTAAGAYQIIEETWRGIIENKLIFDEEKWFTPVIQDRMAVIQIEARDALSLLRKGDIEAVVEKCRREWTSLPGAAQNAGRSTTSHTPMDMAHFMSLFDKYFSAEKAANGL
jgi:muramidase (phage lysozyme)